MNEPEAWALRYLAAGNGPKPHIRPGIRQPLSFWDTTGRPRITGGGRKDETEADTAARFWAARWSQRHRKP